MINQTRIGIDIGRVIIAGDTDQGNPFFSRNFLQAPPVDDAIATITQLTSVFGPENVFLVSKCGTATAQRSMLWLHHQDFFTMTGIAPAQVHFCEERHEKKIICDMLDIEIFIDDRYTVLEHLLHLSKCYLFQPFDHERALNEKRKRKLRNIRVVESWQELAAHLSI